MKIGPTAAIAPDEARAKAKALLGCVASGGDPYAEAQAAVEAAEKAKREAAAAERVNALTLAKLIEGFEAKYASRKRNGPKAMQKLRFHLAAWLDRPAHSLTPAEFVQRLDTIAEDRGPIAANRTLAYARKMFNWAVARQLVPSNPLTGIPRPAEEKSRDRALSNDELAAVWKAADELGKPFRAFVRLLILTMQRRDEVAGIRWSELSPDRTLWTIPAGRAKNGKAHIVHLSPQAQAALATVQSFKPGCDLVFTTTGERPISGFSRAKERLDKLAKITSWRLHDLRRTGVTGLADMGFAPHVCDRLLNHVSGTISGVAAVYQRSQFLPERKRALEAWGEHMEALASGQPAGNVESITEARAARTAA